MENQPNIFDYATSELSQDAFICYLLEFGKTKHKNTKEYECAKKFLNKCGIDEDVNKIHTQYKHIDVLIETENYLLIIEDKTYSNEHGDQILHYVNNLKNDELNKDKRIVACYLKTSDYLHEYEPNKEKMSKLGITKDNFKYFSLNRYNVMDFIKESENFILKSFYTHLENFSNKECEDNDLSTWDKSKWFEYLQKLFKEYGIYENESKNKGYCDINNYVPNPSGGFYATHFNWRDLPEEMQTYFDNKQTKAGTYNQLELFFSDGKTSGINLAYRFHSNNWDREETKKYRNKGILSELQGRIKTNGYKNQNRMGASTAYKIISYGDNERAYKPISKETTVEILKEIENFIKNE